MRGRDYNHVDYLKLIEELIEEAREIRRKSADWNFISRQPEPLKTALIYLIEDGDLYVASKIAGLTVDEMDKLRIKAKIPIVIRSKNKLRGTQLNLVF